MSAALGAIRPACKPVEISEVLSRQQATAAFDIDCPRDKRPLLGRKAGIRFIGPPHYPAGEREEESMLRIEGGGVWWWGRHFESCVLWFCFLRTESLPSIYVVEEYHVLQPIRDLHK